MDSEALRAAIQGLASTAAEATAAATRTEVKLDALTRSQLESHEEGRRNHATLALGLQQQGLAIARLQRAVHGSDPPVDPGEPLEGGAPLDELAANAVRVASSASLEVAALEGRMIRGFAEMQEATRNQNTALGIGARGVAYLFSPAGRRDVIKLAALAAALLGYDQARRPPPPPVYVTPPAQVAPVRLPPAPVVP